MSFGRTGVWALASIKGAPPAVRSIHVLRAIGRLNIGRIYVATAQNDNRVLGYYTLANGSVTFQSAPRSKGLPREYPIPVILLARLAIDMSMQGKGLGAALIYDALKRAAEVAEISAAYAVIVVAFNEQAKAFYLHYRFEESLDDPMRLFLPMRDIRALPGKTGA